MSVELVREEGLVWLEFERGRGNILDRVLVAELTDAVREVERMEGVLVLAFRARGTDFCFGASVAEHQAALAPQMLSELHDFFRVLEATAIPTAAAVRGRCLGGGLELATWCGRVVATPEVVLAVPEIKLGVFPPIGTLSLTWRIGGARASDLVLTGREIGGEEALRLGVVDELAADPEAAVRSWYQARFRAISGSSMRFAWRATRRPIRRMLEEDLPGLEAMYLQELMATHDANEGIGAFLDKRPARYTHR